MRRSLKLSRSGAGEGGYGGPEMHTACRVDRTLLLAEDLILMKS